MTNLRVLILGALLLALTSTGWTAESTRKGPAYLYEKRPLWEVDAQFYPEHRSVQSEVTTTPTYCLPYWCYCCYCCCSVSWEGLRGYEGAR